MEKNKKIGTVARWFKWGQNTMKMGARIPCYKENFICGYLHILDQKMIGDEMLIRKLVAWRNQAKDKFFTSFDVTEKGTKQWLEKFLWMPEKEPECIFFMVEDRFCHFIGHIGFADIDYLTGKAEIDSVLRGGKSPFPGFFQCICRSLIEFGSKELGISVYDLSVFADNKAAISLYKNLGFKEISRFPTVCVEKNDAICYEVKQRNDHGLSEENARWIVNFSLCL